MEFLDVKDDPVLGFVPPAVVTVFHTHVWGGVVDYRWDEMEDSFFSSVRLPLYFRKWTKVVFFSDFSFHLRFSGFSFYFPFLLLSCPHLVLFCFLLSFNLASSFLFPFHLFHFQLSPFLLLNSFAYNSPIGNGVSNLNRSEVVKIVLLYSKLIVNVIVNFSFSSPFSSYRFPEEGNVRRRSWLLPNLY